MSQENEKIVRRLLEALARRDREAVAGLLHPEIEWWVTDIFVEAPVHHGRERVVEFLLEFAAAWESLAIELDAVSAHGPAAVVSGRLRGRAPSSGIEIEAPRTWVMELREGMVWRWSSFTSLPEALEAVAPSGGLKRVVWRRRLRGHQGRSGSG